VRQAVVIGIAALAGVVLAATAGDGSAPKRPAIAPPTPAAAEAVPSRALLPREPYLGVSCRRPNSIACDRVGLAVWLRSPARAVEAEIDGRRVALDDRESSAPPTMFAGFLQPAGLSDGELRVRPDAGPGRWIGRRPVSARVRLWVTGEHGTMTTSLVVGLHAGWG
jgi:hypothetical protein